MRGIFWIHIPYAQLCIAGIISRMQFREIFHHITRQWTQEREGLTYRERERKSGQSRDNSCLISNTARPTTPPKTPIHPTTSHLPPPFPQSLRISSSEQRDRNEKKQFKFQMYKIGKLWLLFIDIVRAQKRAWL